MADGTPLCFAAQPSASVNREIFSTQWGWVKECLHQRFVETPAVFFSL